MHPLVYHKMDHHQLKNNSYNNTVHIKSQGSIPEIEENPPRGTNTRTGFNPRF